MEKISFLNDKFLPHSQCLVHIEDRGFQMADGVYEVILFKNQKLIDFNHHIKRLFRSLNELQIKFEKNSEQLKEIALELFKRNNLGEGSIYLQITRGFAPRQQNFPNNCTPTFSATVSPLKQIDKEQFEKGFKVITHQDIRWQRCDIKSIALIASSMMRQKAFDCDCDDAILIRENCVTEATFANVFIIDEEENLITRNADNFILCGITRNRIIEIAKQNEIRVLEKKFTKEELLKAKEVFLSSTTLLVRPIVKIDNQIIGGGKAGKISQKLLGLYNQFINNR